MIVGIIFGFGVFLLILGVCGWLLIFDLFKVWRILVILIGIFGIDGIIEDIGVRDVGVMMGVNECWLLGIGVWEFVIGGVEIVLSGVGIFEGNGGKVMLVYLLLLIVGSFGGKGGRFEGVKLFMEGEGF